MLCVGNNLLLGFQKPGCRKDDDFFEFSFARLEALLGFCSEHDSGLMLIGRHFGSLKLYQWLRVIALLGNSNVPVYVVCHKRPTDDLIAMHRAGHLNLIVHGAGGVLKDGSNYTTQSDSIFITNNKLLLQIDTRVGQITLDDGDTQRTPDIIQVTARNAGYMHVARGIANSIHQLNFADSKREHELVSMDYVDSLPVTTANDWNSEFSARLVEAANAKTESRSMQAIITTLDVSAECKGYLLDLAGKAQTSPQEYM